ncbi:hypothetical protein EJD97_005027, partial [Solanum chilense]
RFRRGEKGQGPKFKNAARFHQFQPRNLRISLYNLSPRLHTSEEPQNFLDEIKKIIEVMQVTRNDQWKENRGTDATPITWNCFSETFLDRFFTIELREARDQEFINIKQDLMKTECINDMKQGGMNIDGLMTQQFEVSVKDSIFETPTFESVLIVSEFLEVFPEDLPSISPEREIDVGIDLLPKPQPVSIYPYRMYPT